MCFVKMCWRDNIIIHILEEIENLINILCNRSWIELKSIIEGKDDLFCGGKFNGIDGVVDVDQERYQLL